ncbi:hypothetical protein [Rhizorhabdus phycosphaerae]|uniref:hypothetical protein n=1 Tax=Rhizorhabdus phycosphaerae TaxID=2711156 RepID=UPI0013EE1932|nr:hypothetical protein [Rhizorhabdus phycosphaerae]
MPITDIHQLRREAEKARILANNAFTEGERQQLQDVASSLEREATLIELEARRQSVRWQAGEQRA